MDYIVNFAKFWYDFIIGDDWTVAAFVAAALVVIALLAHGGIKLWWLLPVVVVLALGGSVWRVARSTPS